MKSQQELFEDLYTRVPPEEYAATLKALGDAANDKTAHLQQAREVAHRAYSQIDRATNEQWEREWVAARDELLKGRDDD